MDQLDFGDLRDTLKEEKERLLRERANGTSCRACNQFVKVYHRPIHRTMAAALIHFYRKTGADTVKFYSGVEVLRSFPSLWGDFSKLQSWGLIEEKPYEDGDGAGRTSGFWRMTEKGNRFVRGEMQLPRHVIIYNNTVLGFSEDRADIRKCLGKKFNYQELMSR